MVGLRMNAAAQRVLDNFIVLEGLDGSGTSTQLELVTRELVDHDVPAAATCEPTAGPVGVLIREILTGKKTVSSRTLARLFAADREEHLSAPEAGIEALLAAGRLVICDRYLFSSLAYQSLETDFEYILSLNRGFPLPAILIYIDTPVAVCAERRRRRGSTELFDDSKIQERVSRGYELALAAYRDAPLAIERVDGTLGPEKIRDRIWTILSTLPIVKG